MAMLPDDRRALVARLGPGGGTEAAEAVAEAVEDDEELREVLVDVDGEVVAFTDRRALFVATGAASAEGFGYDAIEVRRRGEGLGIDAMVEAGRLVLEVARGTFARLGVVTQGAPPSRASWLPLPRPKVRAEPPPVAPLAAADLTAPAPPQPTPGFPPVPASGPWGPTVASPTASYLPAPPASPPVRRSTPPPGWHPDPARIHWWRWWDGRDWTDFVADGGAPTRDPLPPR